MVNHSRKIGHGLILVSVVLTLQHVSARSVSPITFGYEMGTPVEDLLAAAVPDLAGAAAEPRPVYVELVKRPLSLPLVAEPGAVSADSAAAPVISASENVEKVLRTPMAFSYNTDQVNAASDHVAHSPKEKLASANIHPHDQQPAAIDFYKYLAHHQDDEKDSGSPAQEDKEEILNLENSEKKEVEDKSADLRQKSKPQILLSYSPSNFFEEFTKNPSHAYHKTDDEKKSEETKDEKKDDGHSAHEDGHHHHHADAGSKSEASEAHEEHKAESQHGDSKESSSEGGKKQEEAQASASHHGEGGDGGNYKKGGGKEFEQVHAAEHGEVGKKEYSGKHHHEKGEKGHKDKDDHVDEYEENIGHKEGHHDENGYDSEHHHGEEGKRGTQFHEEGEHSKGHSTKGEHNIHKKDEFEKKQEFYDESHEGGEHEKHGEYFHEDDYNKGGHHKSSHEDGGHHEEKYGKNGEHEEGGHKHADSGHKKAVGREVHHNHEDKEGGESGTNGGKRWKYEEGEGGGDGGDNKGAHQTVQEVKDGKADSSDHGKAEDSKGSSFHIIEVTSKKIEHNNHKVQTAEDKASPGEELHGQHSHDDFNYDFANNNGNTDAVQDNNGAAADHNNARLQEGVNLYGAETRSQNAEQQPNTVPEINYADALYPNLYGAEARPQKAQEQPASDVTDPYLAEAEARSQKTQALLDQAATYVADVNYPYLYGAGLRPRQAQQQPTQDTLNAYGSNPVARLVQQQSAVEHPNEPHVHADGEICPGNQHSVAESAPIANIAKPDEPLVEHQAQESAPKPKHVIVVGNDGNIYGILPHGGALFNEAT